jgi:thiamine biosynthesis lipoprotein
LKLSADTSNIISGHWSDIHRLQRFEHLAMATVFEIFLAHNSRQYAAQAVQAAFAELDRLEQELSRFVENSDISRINSSGGGKWIKAGLDTINCLQSCQQIRQLTHGAFDIRLGTLVDFWQGRAEGKRLANQFIPTDRDSTVNGLEVDSTNQTVRILKTGLQIDLGGFGKGYALDRMAEVLADWGISCALLHSGYSTVLALQAPVKADGWPLALKHPLTGKVLKRVSLINSAISGSGNRKGTHIINPLSARPVKSKLAAWATAKTAARADALSTSFMIMSNISGFIPKVRLVFWASANRRFVFTDGFKPDLLSAGDK